DLAQSRTPIYVAAGAIVVALIVALVVMSGGGDDSTAPAAALVSTSPAPAASGTAAAKSTPASPNVATLPKPIAFNIPATGADAQLGPVDRITTQATIDALRAAKVDLKGVDVFVYPIYGGTKDSLIVFDVDATASGPSSSSTQDQFVKVLAGIPALK